ncbi:hypothetical protein JTE90_014014 [Oedothorax gibbosus]|uniref:PRANC domain-containing protein n=1 Tax=Oedothorax gibbosus TaxID=931172 RepID=A0AAV6U4S8_9ARAC|nr:hypothetical protein JTE90_014014 [Oedothorax gibbosus]
MGWEIMNDDLIRLFQAMLSQSHFAEALKIVSMKHDEIPPPSVINDILTNILMKNCVKTIANEANAYLTTYLYLLPNKSQHFQYDYAGVLYNKNGELKDTWSTFSYIIESCFAHYKIPTGKEWTEASEVIKYPNCSILMNFYVNVTTKFLSVEYLFEDKPNECFSSLFNWISVAFNHHTPLEIDELLKNLQTVLDEALKFYVLDPENSSEMVHNMVKKFSGFFKDANSLKLFGALTEVKEFHSKICQHIMYERLYEKQLWRNIHAPLTLKTIILHYFFEETFEVKYEPLVNKETKEDCGSEARKQVKNLFKNDDNKGDGVLHGLCRNNEFGDLLGTLLDNPNVDPNEKNHSLRTPLHIACLAKSFLCVENLLEGVEGTLLDNPNVDPNEKNHSLRTPLHKACLDKSFLCVENLLEGVEEVSGKVDLEAADKYGFTPLHCAVYRGYVKIAHLLLKHGGSPLLALKDNFGKEPITYASSNSMKKLLLRFELPFKFDKTDYYVRTYSDQEECYIFLYGLYSVLKNYVENFKLDDYKKGVTVELSHKEKKCPHYVHNVQLTDCAVCDEDASVFECLSVILDHYLQNIQKISEETGWPNAVD